MGILTGIILYAFLCYANFYGADSVLRLRNQLIDQSAVCTQRRSTTLHSTRRLLSSRTATIPRWFTPYGTAWLTICRFLERRDMRSSSGTSWFLSGDAPSAQWYIDSTPPSPVDRVDGFFISSSFLDDRYVQSIHSHRCRHHRIQHSNSHCLLYHSNHHFLLPLPAEGHEVWDLMKGRMS